MEAVELDRTTYYSILGLTPTATDLEISKAFRSLARKLHPDKSKFKGTEELFKLIVHAHSILSNKEEKIKYDQTLVVNGVFGSDLLSRQDDKDSPSSKFYQRQSKPYEDQPYGFGFENGNNGKAKSSKSEVPIFKSFNLKSYQRNQRKYDEPEVKYNKKRTEVDRREDNGNENVQVTDEEEGEKSKSSSSSKIHMTENTDPNFGRAGSEGVHDDPSNEANSVPLESNNESEYVNGKKGKFNKEHNAQDPNNGRSKLHKKNIDSNMNNPFGHIDSMPVWESGYRHFVRAKHEAKEYDKRSTSPVKMTPTSYAGGITEDWSDSLKDLIDRMNNIDNQRPEMKRKSSIIAKESLFFDMHNINESLDSIPAPISKKSKKNAAVQSDRIDSENLLHKPVNRTLPRIYRTEPIQESDLSMHSSILERDFPKIPNLQINMFDKNQLEECKKDVIIFCEQCGEVKKKILSVYMERLSADIRNTNRLTKIENFSSWKAGRNYDFELAKKLHELEYKQNLVVHTYTSLVNSVYTS